MKSTCVVNTPEEFASAIFDGINGQPPIAEQPNRNELFLKFIDGIFAQAFAKETELRQTISYLNTELERAQLEHKQLLELSELNLVYISNLEASNESLSKQKSILAWVAALYHDRFIDLTITERDSDQLAYKKAQENTCHHCGKELAEAEGVHYEQGLLCDECPDKEIVVWKATTGEATLYDKTFIGCCSAAAAWFKNDFEGTILQHAMTVGDYYSLPEYQG